MKLILSRTPAWPSPYGPRGALVPLPERMRYLHPAALRSLSTSAESDPFALAGPVTDVFRSPVASMEARTTKRGVQPPGFSAHNFGLAVDVDVGRTLKAQGWGKGELDRWMLARGWQCYRADDAATASEAWHYTYGTDGPGSAAVEECILRIYGDAFEYDAHDLQRNLAAMRLYDGAIDGKIGPQSRAALAAFQRSMDLPATGRDYPRTRRVLSVAAAEQRIVPANWSGA